jgi:mRNA interferase MazF
VQIVRYGIYWVDLNPPGKGHEQRERRPCVVVSPDPMHQTQMAAICPLTTTLRNWPFRLRIPCNGKPSEIMVDQIRAVSLKRFDAYIEVLDANKIKRLKEVIALMFTI